ncbi:DLW-39 family protein [Nocardioides sp. cx-169]|uniref:DLW-39 family protein n=1 Tax=Nocardioides sp. cx-169 TaxID=2899080 RepID=UPI001E63BC3E|nr:DLW-39 family protein [Nocardioides sp. cx-169]MCD4533091.1 DLW-39 family protein [Nocardioides sp. cx-169]
MGLRKKKTLMDQANDYVEAAKPHVEAAYESAREFVQDTAVPALLDAREKAAPVLADAREKASAAASEARDKAVPLIATGAALASEKAASAKAAADAKVAQLKGEPEPKKGGKLKKFVIFAAIAGAVAFVAKKLQGSDSAADNWQSSYVPTPPPTSTEAAAPAGDPAPAAEPVPTDDPGGSSPDEALADAAETPHPVTTPDDPAEVVEVQDPKS